MTTIITKSLVEQFSVSLVKKLVEADYNQTRHISVDPSKVPSADAYYLGLRFHALMRKCEDDPVRPQQNELMPWCSVVRDELRSVGVTRVESEVSLRAARGLPAGRCDLIVHGGLAPLGIVEVKVVNKIGGSETKALLQVAGYAELLSAQRDFKSPWLGLVFVSFAERKVAFQFHRGSTRLRRAACTLLSNQNSHV